MYQVWQIVDNLPEDEKAFISQDLIDEIKGTMEVDDSFTIDFDIPLEKQKLDDKAWNMLKKVLKNAKKNGYGKTDSVNVEAPTEEKDINQFRLENIELNQKLSQSKKLIIDISKSVEKLQNENKKLMEDNAELLCCINRVPKLFRKMFFKDATTKLIK